jgi:hypothetical protein
MANLHIDAGPVVFAGDWHGSLQQAFRGINYAKQAGAKTILHVGDFGIWPGETKKFLDRLNTRLSKEGLDLAFIDGNHEDHPWLAAQERDEHGTSLLRPHVRYLPRGTRLWWAGFQILAVGGAASIDRKMRTPGKSWWQEELISDEDVDRAINGTEYEAYHKHLFDAEADILLCHDSPAGAPNSVCDDSQMQYHAYRYFGEDVLSECTEHRKQLKRISDAALPWLVVHGHYHMYMEGTFEHPVQGLRAKVVGLDQGTNVPGKSTLLLTSEDFEEMIATLDRVDIDKSGQGGIVES